MGKYKEYLEASVLVVSLLVGVSTLLVTLHLSNALHPSRGFGQVPTTPNSSSAFPNCISSGDETTCWESVTMAAGSATAFLQNTSSQTQWIDLAQVITNSTASSSYNIYVGATSTQAAVTNAAQAYTAPLNPSLINAWGIATSSAATSTSSFDSTVHATGLSHIVLLPTQQFLYMIMQTQSAAGAAVQTSGMVESATSTARGFNPQLIVEFHATTTLSSS